MMIMETNHLTDADYTKILSFLSQINNFNNDYQQHILRLFDEIFGYKYSTFNFINNNLELYSTKGYNIADNLTKSYYDYYYKTDIFNPKNRTDLQYNKNVLAIKDIMPTSQYENTEFYSDFLKKEMLYYELALPLKINNKLVAGIGVYKTKDDKDFSDRDIAILSKLNEFISNYIWVNSEYSSIQKECQRYNKYFEEIPTGIIILNKRFSIMRYNRAAEAFAGNLQKGNSPYNSIRQFIDEIFSKYYNEINNSQTNITTHYKSYRITIMSNLISPVCEGLEPFYLIFITELNGEKEETAERILKSYNLSTREAEILELVKNGLSNKEIADNLGISKYTVKAHLENIFNKLQVKNRTSAINKINTKAN